MVLTRAQRAQAKGSPPESPPKPSLAKAPVRRGRPKKTEEEPAPKSAPKATEPKTAPLKSSVSKASASARTATTKSSAAKTAAPKATTNTTKPKEKVAKTAALKATSNTTALEEKAATKAPAAKSTAPKTLAIKTASLRASTTKKQVAAKKGAKTSRAAKPAAPAADGDDELAKEKDQIEVQDFAKGVDEQAAAPATVHKDTVMEDRGNEQDTMASASMISPSKLPRSALPVPEPRSPFKLSMLSPSKILGSLRKPPFSTVLFATPAKSNPVLEHEPVNVGSPKRPNAVEELVGLAKSPIRPNATSEEPLKESSTTRAETASIFQSPVRPVPTPARPIFSQSVSKPEPSAMLSQSPVRPNTAMKRSVLGQSTSIAEKPLGISQTPVRPNFSQQNAFSQSLARSVKAPDFAQSTNKRSAVPFSDSVLVSPKRIRTSLSMPSLNMGSPNRTSSTQSGSPPSPVKSSMRSPEKRIVSSPKKVSWHQSPRPQPVVEEMPAEKIPGPLAGLVFFLDVNKTNGENSNQLFVPLIEELGGECVPEWSSNGMGVTHVVFMNGEMRTLEKVVATNGQVHCVNISWVLDCERENLHLDEKEFKYAIDLTRIPGLLTPKPMRSYNSSATPIPSRTPAAPPPYQPTTPAREPLGHSYGLIIKTPAYLAANKTPASVGGATIPEDWDDKENVSPQSENTPLMQKTCPPKQMNKSIFTLDEAATPFRERLLLARRRSAEFVPKIGSPLRRGLGA